MSGAEGVVGLVKRLLRWLRARAGRGRAEAPVPPRPVAGAEPLSPEEAMVFEAGRACGKDLLREDRVIAAKLRDAGVDAAPLAAAGMGRFGEALLGAARGAGEADGGALPSVHLGEGVDPRVADLFGKGLLAAEREESASH